MVLFIRALEQHMGSVCVSSVTKSQILWCWKHFSYISIALSCTIDLYHFQWPLPCLKEISIQIFHSVFSFSHWPLLTSASFSSLGFRSRKLLSNCLILFSSSNVLYWFIVLAVWAWPLCKDIVFLFIYPFIQWVSQSVLLIIILLL